MSQLRKFLSALLLVATIIGLLGPAAYTSAQTIPTSYDVPNGHFFPREPDGAGFLLADAGGVALWREYERLGGLSWFGPAASRRWQWGDRLAQATQAAVLLWSPTSRTAEVANTLDVLHDQGFDDTLAARYNIPKQVGPEPSAANADQARQQRLAWLDQAPGVKRLYTATPNADAKFGFPTAPPFDAGPYRAVRFQKVVALEWQNNGSVTLVNLGQVLAELKWLPEDATRPEPPARLTVEADRKPWSGWWWPASAGASGPKLYDPGGPLDKYDAYVVALGQPNPQTRQWEFERNRITQGGYGWAGHCNGFAAASILEPEPTAPISQLGVNFTVGDLKGLLTAYHFADAPLWAVGSETGGLGPAEFHRAVGQWLGVNRKPMVATFFNGPEENWSYPVYRANIVTGPDPVESDTWHVRATLWFATFEAPINHVGTIEWPGPAGKTFTYTLRGPRDEPFGGEWTGDSRFGLYGHPGRLWYPDPQTRNVPELVTSPGLQIDLIRRLWR